MGERCLCCGYENSINDRYCQRCGLPLFGKARSKRIGKQSILSKIKNLFKKRSPVGPTCSQCGNELKVLLPKLEREDPTVYKCDHCRCTQTTGGTSMCTPDGKLIPLWTRQEKIIRLGEGKLKFTGKIYASVGWDYRLNYPEWAFKVNRKMTYCHPEMMGPGLCGGDEAIAEYELEPHQKGLFEITELQYFRGKIEELIIHFYLVE